MEQALAAAAEPRRRTRWIRRALGALALALAAGFLATRALAARAESAHPPAGSFAEVAGLEQHYVERGAGEPIVLVHGAFGTSHDFLATVVDALAERYRCVAWDRPGHGYSERPREDFGPGEQADLLIELVGALGLERPLLVGFSYGGAVTLTAALRHPDAVRGVVLLNGPSHPWPDPLDFQYVLPAVPVVGRLAVETVMTPLAELLAPQSIERVFAPRPVPEHFERSPVSLSLRPASFRANAADIRALKPFLRAQCDDYGALEVPLTLVVSEADRVVSPTIHSPALHAAAPESTMVRLPDAGHQILYTHADLVVGVVEAAMELD